MERDIPNSRIHVSYDICYEVCIRRYLVRNHRVFNLVKCILMEVESTVPRRESVMSRQGVCQTVVTSTPQTRHSKSKTRQNTTAHPKHATTRQQHAKARHTKNKKRQNKIMVMLYIYSLNLYIIILNFFGEYQL